MKKFRSKKRWNNKSYKKRSTRADEPTPIIDPRSESEVFADLSTLCTMPGYIHALAFVIYRDGIITGGDVFTKDDFLKIYSPKRLIRTEISVLIGLMLKGDLDLEIPHPTTIQSMIDSTDRLMDELHQAMLAPARVEYIASLKALQSGEAHSNPLRSGTALREAMFYGAESAFTSQYIEFSKARYEADNGWLVEQRGFTIREAAQIADAIIGSLAKQFTPRLKSMILKHPSTWTMLDLFCFTADEAATESGLPRETVDRFLNAYSAAPPYTNDKLVDATALNAARVFPFIELSDGRYTSLLEYNTSEAIYDNAFYWMMLDDTYRGTASNNRGAFTETLCLNLLERVIPANSLFRNVTFKSTKGKAGTEADAIILYGRRAIVFQAKSKRLTEVAKSGDDIAISRDFQNAVQAAYDQAVSCIKALKSGDPAYDARGKVLPLPDLSEIQEYYPICITSEHYPALSLQVAQFLKEQRGDGVMPALVLDIFTLDIITEFLDSTLLFTDYISKRSSLGDKINSSHEMVILSYHLRSNLYLPPTYNFLMIEDDFLADLDLAVNVRRRGLPGPDTPPGILTRNLESPLGYIFKQIDKSNSADVHRIGEFLLGLSGESFNQISRFVGKILKQTKSDGLGHDISVPIEEGSSGITIHCNSFPIEEASQTLRRHCELRKYAERAERWYGLNLAPNGTIRLAVGIEMAWKPNPSLDQEASNLKARAAGRWIGLDGTKAAFSRNAQCPCGSGRKYKRCHGATAG